MDQRLEAYNDNAWDVIIMENVDIPPNKIAKFLIKVTSEFSPTIRYSLKYQNKFVITSALSPYPQINDGVYDTQDKFDYVTLKNSAKENWRLKKGSILAGVNVLQSLYENYAPYTHLSGTMRQSCSTNSTTGMQDSIF